MENKKPTNGELRTYVETLYTFAQKVSLPKEGHDSLNAIYRVLLAHFPVEPTTAVEKVEEKPSVEVNPPVSGVRTKARREKK